MAFVLTFTSNTGSFPSTVDLAWTLDSDLEPTEEIQIRRAESIYPLPDEGELIFNTTDSNVLTFTDRTLSTDEPRYYYYAVYVFDSATTEFTEQTPDTRDRSLGYIFKGEGERLFNQLPAEIQDNDFFFGNHLKKLFEVIGNIGDYYRCRAQAHGFWRRPEIQDERLLDFYSEMFGFAPERGFDLRVLRNLAMGLIAVYKKKGTCQGLVDFTKIFTTWDSICDDTVDLSFKTWDGGSQRNLSFLTGVGPGKALDTNANLPINVFTNGKFVDPEDDPFYTILGNDETSVTFSFKTPPFRRLDGTDGEGTTQTVFEDTTQTWIVDEWRGFRLFIDSFSSTEYFVIVSNTSDTLILNPLFTNFGTPLVFQQVGIDTVAPLPTAYRIEPEYYVQNGRHSLLFDNTVPDGFRGLTKDPAHFLFGGSRSLLSLGPFAEQSLILIIQGQAEFVGRSTDLTVSVLEDLTIDFGAIDSLVGLRLNPNILQSQDFEIISNTSTTITVQGNLLSVAAVGTNYFVIDEFNAIKAKRLRQVIPEFVPYYANTFLFFEPK